MKKKIAVVTGSSRGIGKAIAIQLAKENYEVIINYLNNKEKANDVFNEISNIGKVAHLIKADVSSQKEVENMLNEILEKYETIDLLINNAGIRKDHLLVKMPEESWDSVINTNLKSIYLTSKFIGYEMIKNKSGKIINITSTSAFYGTLGQANYVATKSAIIGLTKTMAREFAKFGILVNAVAPGFIETDMISNTTSKMGDLIANIPLGRIGIAQEVADMVAFIASDKCNYTTGHTFFVDGGLVI